MKTIKLTDEQKQKLLRPNAYMSAVFGDGIEWTLFCYSDESIYLDDVTEPLPAGDYGYNRKDDMLEIEKEPGFYFINDTALQITKDSEDSIYYELSCNDCSGSGVFTINYNPETQIFSTTIERYLRLSQTSENMKTFEEWASTQPQYQWQKYEYLKKLLDPEFIEEYKNKGEGGVFELVYNGGGDSGQIEEPTDITQDIEYLGYEIIDFYHSGWENNEGADGRIVIDFNQRTISLYHEQYYEEGEYIELEKYQLV
jgi:hypothetical protein